MNLVGNSDLVRVDVLNRYCYPVKQVVRKSQTTITNPFIKIQSHHTSLQVGVGLDVASCH